MRDKVYHTLLGWITEGVLQPGEKLSDKALAESLGVSRTPVREALGRLEEKALVEASANRWTRVSRISMDEADLIYPIIWTLETLAAEMALPRLTARDLRQMQTANDRLAGAIFRGDALKASEADAAFHDIYIRQTRNPYLGDILCDLKIRHRRLEVFYFGGCACARASVDEHRRIVAAFKRKHRSQVVDLIRANWQTSLERLRTCAAADGTPAGRP